MANARIVRPIGAFVKQLQTPPVDDAVFRSRWWPAALLLVHLALVWCGRAPMLLTRQDDARYLVLSRALRVGTFRDLMWPGAPFHHLYPPGYPALLAIWSAIGGERFDWIVALQAGMSGLTLLLMYDASRRALGRQIALAALAALALNPSLMEWAGQIASEPPLALCMALAIWASQAMAPGRRQVAIIVVAAAMAPLMRTAGVVLPCAVVLHWLLQRRYRDAGLAAIVSVIVVGTLAWWILTDPSPVPGSSYAGDVVRATGTGAAHGARVTFLGELLRRLTKNAIDYPTRIIPWLLPMPTVVGTIIDNVFATVAIGLAVTAGLVGAARRSQLATLVVLGTVGLLWVWPYREARYVVPILPVVLPMTMLGVAGLGRFVSPRTATLALTGAVLLIAGTGAWRSMDALRQKMSCGATDAPQRYNCVSAEQQEFFQAVDFIRDSLPTDARILSAKSEPLYLYSGRITAPFARLFQLDSASFWSAVQRDGTDYILLTDLQELERAYLAPWLSGRCGDLQLVKAFSPSTLLFRSPPDAIHPLTGAVGNAVTESVAESVAERRACDALSRYRSVGTVP